MTPFHSRRYTPEEQEKALRLANEIGFDAASSQLGIAFGTILKWRKKRDSNEMSERRDGHDRLARRPIQQRRYTANQREQDRQELHSLRTGPDSGVCRSRRPHCCSREAWRLTVLHL